MANDKNPYSYDPSHASNLAALILFAMTWAAHFLLGLYYQQWWFGTAFFIGCALETAGYIGRFVSSSDPLNVNAFLVQIVCLSIAPAFFMAGVYYLLAKFSVIYPGVSRLRPMWYSYIFVSCDLLSIVLQGIGGGMAATAFQDDKDTQSGTNIMVAGLAVQVFFMTLFMVLCTDFYIRVRRARKSDDLVFDSEFAHIREKKIMPQFLVAVAVCTILIYIRCIYRLIELAEGWQGFLIIHEAYFLVFEALIMFIGVFALTLIHPGFIFGRTKISVRTAPAGKISDTSSSYIVDAAGVSNEEAEKSSHQA